MKTPTTLEQATRWLLQEDSARLPDASRMLADFEARLGAQAAAPAKPAPSAWRARLPYLLAGAGALPLIAAVLAAWFALRPPLAREVSVARGEIPVQELRPGAPCRFERETSLVLGGAERLTVSPGTRMENAGSHTVELALLSGRVRAAKPARARIVMPFRSGTVQVAAMGAVFSVERSEISLTIRAGSGPVTLELPGLPPRAIPPGETLVVPLEAAGNQTPPDLSGAWLLARKQALATFPLAVTVLRGKNAESGAWVQVLQEEGASRALRALGRTGPDGRAVFTLPASARGLRLIAGQGPFASMSPTGSLLGETRIPPSQETAQIALIPVLGGTGALSDDERAALRDPARGSAALSVVLVRYLLTRQGWNSLPGTPADEALRAAMENGLAARGAAAFYLVDTTAGSPEGAMRLVRLEWLVPGERADVRELIFPLP